MPAPETAYRRQTAVLWIATGDVDNSGERVVSTDPFEIQVRWVSGRRQGLNEEGSPIALDASVLVNRDVPEGSILLLGRLADYDVNLTNTRLFEVISSTNVPDVKNRSTFRELLLMKFRGTLPTQGEE